MIIDGKQRGASTLKTGKSPTLALHLLDASENDSAELIAISGVMAEDDLAAALLEMDERVELCATKYPLYHININPDPGDRELTPEEWDMAVDALEAALGFTGQPRAVVRHKKRGRRHTHVVWSLITKSGRLLPYGNNYAKHQRVAAELARRFGLRQTYHPATHLPGDKHPPRRPSKAATRQAERTGLQLDQIKTNIQAAWTNSSAALPFNTALAEHGLTLARGDRRDYVVMDAAGGVHSLPRMLGIKTAEVRAKLGGIKPETVPTIDTVRAKTSAAPPPAPRLQAPLANAASTAWQALRALNIANRVERQALYQQHRSIETAHYRQAKAAGQKAQTAARANLWAEQKQRQSALWQMQDHEIKTLLTQRRAIHRTAWIKDRQLERNPIIWAWRSITGNRGSGSTSARAETAMLLTALKTAHAAERQALFGYHKAVRAMKLDSLRQRHKTMVAADMANLKQRHRAERRSLSAWHEKAFQSQLQTAKTASAAATQAAGAEQFASTKARLQAMAPRPTAPLIIPASKPSHPIFGIRRDQPSFPRVAALPPKPPRHPFRKEPQP